MTRWVSPTRLQAFHAPLGATVVRAPPQIGIVIVGEITCRRAGVVALVPRRAHCALRYLHHAGIRLVLPKFGCMPRVRAACRFTAPVFQPKFNPS
jgi:hypothetical protein